MNVFTANCPHCGAALQVQQDWIGMEMKCPSCNQSFVLQHPGAMPVPQMVRNNGAMESAVVQKSKEIMSTSLQTVKKIKLKRDIQKILFVLSVLFFLGSCGVFFTAVFTTSPEKSGWGRETVPTDSLYSITVGESSHGTYKNAQNIASNTRDLLALVSKAQKKENLFHISYGLFGIAIFLLFVSIYINQIWHLDADQKS